MDSEDQESLRCPLCGSKDIRQSFPKPLIDSVMALLRFHPHRCRSCRHRFYRRLLPGEAIKIPTEEEAGRKL